MKRLPVNTRAAILVLLAFAIYNVADAFLKHAGNFYSFAETGLYIAIFYLSFVFLFSNKMGGITQPFQSKKKLLHVLRGTSGTCCFLFFIIAIKHITLAEVYTLLLTAPFWVAIWSTLFFKEKVGWHRWLTIIFGFIGVLIVLRPGFNTLELASLMALVSAVGFSLFVIFTKKIGEDEPLINMVTYPIIIDIIIFTPIILYMGEFTILKTEHLLFFITSAFFYFIGTYLSSAGFASGDSSMLASLHYSQIIWGALIGYFIFSEVPEKYTFIGAAIIILSGVYLVYREHLAHQQDKK